MQDLKWKFLNRILKIKILQLRILKKAKHKALTKKRKMDRNTAIALETKAEEREKGRGHIQNS